uniref:Lipase_3 domain-containing protein n=1 Tax=Rhabditophanes sp. KR3021 TaxID=114890 RepID=A0AC35TWL8_9BILA
MVGANSFLLNFIFHIILLQIRTEFSPDFENFIRINYGKKALSDVERLDMGMAMIGSFGGRSNQTEETYRNPVIFVHGTTTRAGIFLPHRNFFLANGYQEGELFATTYSDGGMTGLYQKTMNCEDVKIIRNLIKYVSNYTNSPVDVLGYSMGTAISRKAILGGACVDTMEYLGEPLTSLVDTFIGLAGVAYGFESCIWLETIAPACNLNNGMHCKSKYLDDLNSQPARFEGTTSYSIWSEDDHLVGTDCCRQHCSDLHNANLTLIRNGNDHATIVYNTIELQYKLFSAKNDSAI